MRTPAAFVLVLATVFTPACLEDVGGEPGVKGEFSYADVRHSDHVDGAVDQTRTIQVAEGYGRLVVRATYTIDGAADLKLVDPSGEYRHREEISGSKTVANATWADVANPEAGEWRLELEFAGTADYSFGVYLLGSGEAPLPLYEDADERVENRVDGSQSDTRTFDIPLGTESLTIKADYRVDGSANFVVRDPAFVAKKSDQIAGSKTFENDVWYEVANPLPGSWTLDLGVAGSATYTFGVYY